MNLSHIAIGIGTLLLLAKKKEGKSRRLMPGLALSISKSSATLAGRQGKSPEERSALTMSEYQRQADILSEILRAGPSDHVGLWDYNTTTNKPEKGVLFAAYILDRKLLNDRDPSKDLKALFVSHVAAAVNAGDDLLLPKLNNASSGLVSDKLSLILLLLPDDIRRRFTAKLLRIQAGHLRKLIPRHDTRFDIKVRLGKSPTDVVLFDPDLGTGKARILTPADAYEAVAKSLLSTSSDLPSSDLLAIMTAVGEKGMQITSNALPTDELAETVGWALRGLSSQSLDLIMLDVTNTLSADWIWRSAGGLTEAERARVAKKGEAAYMKEYKQRKKAGIQSGPGEAFGGEAATLARQRVEQRETQKLLGAPLTREDKYVTERLKNALRRSI